LTINELSAQNDTVPKQDDLLNSLSVDSSVQTKLLPEHMLFTQRLLWGEKGLMRSFNHYKLTPENRERELKLRRTMLLLHQGMGAITSLGMIGQAVVGMKLYNGDRNIKDLHEGLAATIDVTYITTATLSLFSPPKMLNERKGYSSIKIHKYLALIHMAGMITTNVLADQLESHPELKKWHRAAAITTLVSFVAAEVIIKF
jgi:hypothetical protein